MAELIHTDATALYSSSGKILTKTHMAESAFMSLFLKKMYFNKKKYSNDIKGNFKKNFKQEKYHLKN